jgi:DNA (cytosine-5)-methyltransferase 1
VFARRDLGVERCAEILALREGVRGHSATGRAAGERAAFCLTASVGRSSEGNRVGNAWNTNYVPLAAHVPATAHTLRAGGFDAGEDGTGRGTPLVAFSTKDHGADASDMARRPPFRPGNRRGDDAL